MKTLRSGSFWGLVLVLGGTLFLFQALGVLKGEDLFWGVMFAIIGFMFLIALYSNRSHWWLALPAMLFVGLGAGLASKGIFQSETGDILEGVFILGGLGLGFILVYLLNYQNWWAVIPGGVLVTLSLVSILDTKYPDKDTGGVFLIGLGLTFALLGLLPRLGMKWAFIPALVLLIIGFASLAAVFSIIKYVWPVLLILVGVYVFLREIGFLRRL